MPFAVIYKCELEHAQNHYGGLNENDHFNQAQAEFKKVLNGQSKQAQAEKKEGRKGGCVPCTQGVAWYTHSQRWTIYIPALPFFYN